MFYVSGLDWGPEDATVVDFNPSSQSKLLHFYWIIISINFQPPQFLPFFGYFSDIMCILNPFLEFSKSSIMNSLMAVGSQENEK